MWRRRATLDFRTERSNTAQAVGECCATQRMQSLPLKAKECFRGQAGFWEVQKDEQKEDTLNQVQQKETEAKMKADFTRQKERVREQACETERQRDR